MEENGEMCVQRVTSTTCTGGDADGGSNPILSLTPLGRLAGPPRMRAVRYSRQRVSET